LNEKEGLREVLAFAEALLVDVWVRVQEANRECVWLRGQLEVAQEPERDGTPSEAQSSTQSE